MNWGKVVPFKIRKTVKWLYKKHKLKIGTRDGLHSIKNMHIDAVEIPLNTKSVTGCYEQLCFPHQVAKAS